MSGDVSGLRGGTRGSGHNRRVPIRRIKVYGLHNTNACPPHPVCMPDSLTNLLYGFCAHCSYYDPKNERPDPFLAGRTEQ